MPGAPGGEATSPSLEKFCEVYDKGRPQVVWTRLVADLETPVSAFLKLAGDRPNSFLLESVEGGAVRGRYSIIGLEPDVIWRANGDSAAINTSPGKGDDFTPCEGGALQALRDLLANSRIGKLYGISSDV